MASDQGFVDHVCELASASRPVTSRKMFGEYALYLDGKVIGLVCDNQLFVKPTAEGRSLLGTVDEQPPFPGAKSYLRIDAALDDRDLIQRLFDVTARALPAPSVPKARAASKAATKKKPSIRKPSGR